MQTAKTGDTVLVDFVVRTSDGRIVGNTEQGGPQAVRIGDAEVFRQVEAALEGMAVGSAQTVTVAAADAFGLRREDMVVQLSRAELPPEPAPQPGMQLAARQQDGSTVQLVITEVGEDTVTVDGNHPLAGEDLHFGLTLVEIRPAA